VIFLPGGLAENLDSRRILLFQQHYNRSNVGRVAAHLFYGDDSPYYTSNVIGCAYTGSICDLETYGYDYAYAVNEIGYYSETFSRAKLFAHELAQYVSLENKVSFVYYFPC
jgi:hypothetical protein